MITPSGRSVSIAPKAVSLSGQRSDPLLGAPGLEQSEVAMIGAPSRRRLFSAGIIDGLFQVSIEGRQNSSGCLWKGGHYCFREVGLSEPMFRPLAFAATVYTLEVTIMQATVFTWRKNA